MNATANLTHKAVVDTWERVFLDVSDINVFNSHGLSRILADTSKETTMVSICYWEVFLQSF